MNKWITRLFMIAGVSLIVAAVGIVAVTRLTQANAVKNNSSIVDSLRAFMPEGGKGVIEDHSNATMPETEISGDNFCGIIEIPQYGTELPIRSSWSKSKVMIYPCKYTGSAYDGTLVIGGSDGDGQFDFIKLISNSDMIYITDMLGMCYTYEVTSIRWSDSANAEDLITPNAELVLFARNSYSLKYVIIECGIR